MELWAPAVASQDTPRYCARTAVEDYERQRVETTRTALLQLVTQIESFPSHYAQLLARPATQEAPSLWEQVCDGQWTPLFHAMRRWLGKDTLLKEEKDKVRKVTQICLLGFRPCCLACAPLPLVERCFGPGWDSVPRHPGTDFQAVRAGKGGKRCGQRQLCSLVMMSSCRRSTPHPRAQAERAASIDNALKVAEGIRNTFLYVNGTIYGPLLYPPTLAPVLHRTCSNLAPPRSLTRSTGEPLEMPAQQPRSSAEARHSPQFSRRRPRTPAAAAVDTAGVGAPALGSPPPPPASAPPSTASSDADGEKTPTATPAAPTIAISAASPPTPMPALSAAVPPPPPAAAPRLSPPPKAARAVSAPARPQVKVQSTQAHRTASLGSQLKQTRAALRQVSPGTQRRQHKRHHQKGHTLLARLVEHTLLERFRGARGEDSSMLASPTPSAAARSVVSSAWASPVSERAAAVA